MLYDLQKDPHENDNVAENRGYAQMINGLSDQLHKHMNDRKLIQLIIKQLIDEQEEKIR
jgi:hypothetical protein